MPKTVNNIFNDGFNFKLELKMKKREIKKYRFEDLNKITVNGKGYFHVKCFKFEEGLFGRGLYMFHGSFIIPQSLPRKKWNEYIDNENTGV